MYLFLRYVFTFILVNFHDTVTGQNPTLQVKFNPNYSSAFSHSNPPIKILVAVNKIDWKTKKIDTKTLRHDITIYEGDYELKENYFEYYHELKNLNLKGYKLIKISGDFNDDYQPGDERILVVLQKL